MGKAKGGRRTRGFLDARELQIWGYLVYDFRCNNLGPGSGLRAF